MPGIKLGTIISAEDPEQRGRLHIETEDRRFTGWAMVALPAPPGTLAAALPEPGTRVVVGDLGERGEEPVVLGFVHTGDTQPDRSVDLLTRAGARLHMSDDRNEVELTLKDGKRILLDDDSVTIEDDGGAKIKMTSNEVTISSPGDLTLSAKGQIRLGALGEVTLIGSSATVEGQSSATVKGGASAEVSAGGQTTVKGAMVMIN